MAKRKRRSATVTVDSTKFVKDIQDAFNYHLTRTMQNPAELIGDQVALDIVEVMMKRLWKSEAMVVSLEYRPNVVKNKFWVTVVEKPNYSAEARKVRSYTKATSGRADSLKEAFANYRSI